MSVVTYEQLIEGIDLGESRQKSNEAKWNFYVSEAARIRPTDYSRRMAIAECASRAIGLIKKGKRAAQDQDPTLHRFANQIKIDRRTLGDWVKAKTFVFDRIEPEERFTFKVSAAIRAVELAPKKKIDLSDREAVAQLYRSVCKDKALQRPRQPLLEYLRAADARLGRAKETDVLLRVEIDQMMKYAASILKKLKALRDENA